MPATTRDEPSLEELQRLFPDQWRSVREQVLRASAGGRPAIQRLIADHAPQAAPADRLASRAVLERRAVERRMLHELLAAVSDRAESGVESGPIRLGAGSGVLLHLALFRRGMVRKPVSMPVYRLAWALARQRARLMPLVRARGVWCFYSRPFVRRLARLVGDGRAVEIAAGDGTLTRFLREAGASIAASDDGSWSHVVAPSADVERLDARAVLRRDRPEVVVCSWPPAGNGFERAVFATPSVRTYVAILGRDPLEAGDPAAYAAQVDFDVRDDAGLGALVLPRGRNRVLVFTRR